MSIEIITPPKPTGNLRIKRIKIDVNGKKTEYPRNPSHDAS